MVRVERVTKIFNPGEVNEVTALRDVSLTVSQRELLVIIGGNGSGKSTLLNLVAGTVFPTEGKIVISDKDLSKVPVYERASLIGRVFQDPLQGTSGGLTIEENFALAAARGEFRGLGPALGRKLREKIRDRLALLGLGLEDRMKTKVGLLSGGQRQAMTILMAVFKRPDVLLLDEHTAALDPRASRKIMDLTRSIVEEQQLTTLMITHNLTHAVDLGRRTIIMNQGRIVRELTSEYLAQMTDQDLLALFWETQRRNEDPDEIDRGSGLSPTG
ncbi:MAG: ATP-binding cassette domain-containing protein [Deltaproteobacteria bacterium]